ncbi:unnamed protein product [Peniophora sp. CBMAI 1063]|nr:unnamed protein product [Peniophora sp. CBMAI 1063]
MTTVRNLSQMQEWVKVYGPNCLVRWFGKMPCLWTIDPVTVAHILSHADDYAKPLEGRLQVARIIPKSILTAEGDVHRKMRKVTNPAFGPSQIRNLHEIFVEKAMNLSELWREAISVRDSPARVDIVDGLSRATLEVIGLAGFGYQLGALSSEGETNELNRAFRATFKNPPKFSFVRVIMEMFPFLDIFPSERAKNLREAKKITDRISMQLLAERKADARSGTFKDTEGVQSRDVVGRDLLTLLVRSNMATDVPDNQRLSDEEVLAQIPTFLVAGHETSSGALAWCLHALAEAPSVQEKLRRELTGVHHDVPSFDELAKLPYLDAVIRETMRVYGPLTTTLRMAVRDDVLPVSKPFKDIYGKMHDEIRIGKGNRIVIPLMGMNQWPSLWGNDALEFRPERWEKTSAEIEGVPGVWGNVPSFGYGPHACIGFRFAIAEMKAFLFTLVRSFEFEPATSAGDVARTGTVLQRPSLLSQPDKGTQLPLRIREYSLT